MEHKPSASNSIWIRLTWRVLVLPAAMIVALAARNSYLLDYMRVVSGSLWTGADRTNLFLSGVQCVFHVLIILVMAHLRVG